MKKVKLFMGFAAIALAFLMTANSYSQWTFQGGVTIPGSSPSISVYSPTGCVVAGGTSGAPKVYRSTNSGVTFTDITGNMTGTPELWCVWAVDANTIYAGDGGANGGAGGNAKVWKTTNGGTSWTVIFTTGGTLGFINGICFSRTSPLVGFIESDPPAGLGQTYWIQKTIDGGATWTQQSPPGTSGYASAQNSLWCVDAQFYGYGLSFQTAAGTPKMNFTSNGGTSWNITTLPLSTTSAFVSGCAGSTDKSTILCSTDMSLPTVARSTNGGVSFSTSSAASGVTGYATIKFLPGSSVCYMTGSTGASGCAEKSTNFGATWTQQTTQGLTGLMSMDLVFDGGSSSVYAYAVATDGSVLRLIDNLTGLDPHNTTVPTAFALQQNYPNPFNPSTTIKYSVPSNSNVSIKIYNSLGKEVMTVVNKYHTVGNYEETVNMNNLSSGIYFYTMIAGDYRDTKKMILVK